MVHQRTRPPNQASSRGGYRGANQTTKCLNCGFGRGQFGVEFCDEYCSLDCYTSAKVTGRNLPHDTRYRRRYEPQAAPWPQGLLVEAPPSPKPWRGRTWSNDSWRTTFTANLTPNDSSSPESVVEWHAVGGGRSGYGPRAGSTGLRERDGSGNGNGTAECGNTNENGSKGSPVAAGGEAALGNGLSGGRHASGGYNADGSRVVEGGATSRRVRSGHGGGKGAESTQIVTGSVTNDDAAAATGNLGGVKRDLPPLAPVPRVGAFPQQRRVVQGGGKVDPRTVAFAVPPGQASCAPCPGACAGAAAAAGEALLPTLPAVGHPEEASSAVGVPQYQEDMPAATESGLGREDSSVAASVHVHPSQDWGHGGDGVAGKVPDVVATVGKTDRRIVVGAAAAVEEPIVWCQRAGENAEMKREVDEARVETQKQCLPAAGGKGGDVEVVGVITSCAPVRAYPTRVAVRQWRHMFLP